MALFQAVFEPAAAEAADDEWPLEAEEVEEEPVEGDDAAGGDASAGLACAAAELESRALRSAAELEAEEEQLAAKQAATGAAWALAASLCAPPASLAASVHVDTLRSRFADGEWRVSARVRVAAGGAALRRARLMLLPPPGDGAAAPNLRGRCTVAPALLPAGRGVALHAAVSAAGLASACGASAPAWLFLVAETDGDDGDGGGGGDDAPVALPLAELRPRWGDCAEADEADGADAGGVGSDGEGLGPSACASALSSTAHLLLVSSGGTDARRLPLALARRMGLTPVSGAGGGGAAAGAAAAAGGSPLRLRPAPGHPLLPPTCELAFPAAAAGGGGGCGCGAEPPASRAAPVSLRAPHPAALASLRAALAAALPPDVAASADGGDAFRCSRRGAQALRAAVGAISAELRMMRGGAAGGGEDGDEGDEGDDDGMDVDGGGGGTLAPRAAGLAQQARTDDAVAAALWA